MGSSWIRDWTMSPTLAGGFFTTEPGHKPPIIFLKWYFSLLFLGFDFFFWWQTPWSHSTSETCPTCDKLLIIYPIKSYKHHRTYPFLHVICTWWHFAIYVFILFWNKINVKSIKILDPNHQRPYLLYTLWCLHRGINKITEEIIEQKKKGTITLKCQYMKQCA